MTEQLREEFEEWWRHEHENTLYCESAWRGWKASRAKPEREVEPWIPVSERLLDVYAQISKGAERMSNRDCKHGQLARSCNICELEEEVIEKAITIAALEREVERLKQQHFTDLCNSADVKRLISVVAYPDNYADQNFSEMAKRVLAKMEQNIKAQAGGEAE